MPTVSSFVAWAYLALIVNSLVVAHWMVKRPYKFARLREAILRHDPRGKHIAIHYAALVGLWYFFVKIYWWGAAAVVLVDAFLWMYLWGYILPILRMQQHAAEMLRTDPNITAASRNEMVMRRRP